MSRIDELRRATLADPEDSEALRRYIHEARREGGQEFEDLLTCAWKDFRPTVRFIDSIGRTDSWFKFKACQLSLITYAGLLGHEITRSTITDPAADRAHYCYFWDNSYDDDGRAALISFWPERVNDSRLRNLGEAKSMLETFLQSHRASLIRPVMFDPLGIINPDNLIV